MTHYRTLKVHRGSDTEEIKAAFRVKAGRHHPDRLAPNMAEKDKLMHANYFAEYATAYSVLKNEESKKAYDKYLDMIYPKCHRCRGTGYTTESAGFTKAVKHRCEDCCGSGILQRRK